MQRQITYKCESCGKDFSNSLECKQHEEKCRNRRYYISQEKERLKRYFRRIEEKGLFLSIRYETSTPSRQGVCLISLVENSKEKPKKANS